MKKFILFLLIYPSFTFAQVDILSVLEPSLVKIAILLPDNKIISKGTAFFIENDSTLISAAHVYVKAEDALISIRKGAIVALRYSRQNKLLYAVPITPHKVNYAYDLVSFKVNPKLIKSKCKDCEITPLLLASNNPIAGESILLFGYYGSDKFPIVLKSIISGSVNLKTNQTVTELLVDKIVNSGQSGGPILSETSMKLVGIILSTIRIKVDDEIQSGISRGAAVESIRQFLSKH